MNLMGLDVAPETTIYALFLVIGAIFLLFELRLLMFPGRKGIIVGSDDILGSDCNSCRSKSGGKMSLGVTVLTDSGKKVKAEMSPCVMCLNKVVLGSRVGVTKVGSRFICQRIIEPMGAPKDAAKLPENLQAIKDCGCSPRPRGFKGYIKSTMKPSTAILVGLLVAAIVLIGVSVVTGANNLHSGLQEEDEVYDLDFADGSGFQEPVLRYEDSTSQANLDINVQLNQEGAGPVIITVYEVSYGTDGQMFEPLGGYSTEPMLLNSSEFTVIGTPVEVANATVDLNGTGDTANASFVIDLEEGDIGDHIYYVTLTPVSSQWTFAGNDTTLTTRNLVMTETVKGEFETLSGMDALKEDMLNVPFFIGFVSLILFFAVIILSLKGVVPQDRLPIQAALVLAAFVIVLMTILGWYLDKSVIRISAQDMAGMVIIHPITALVAGFMVAGALEAAGAFDAAADALNRMENLKFGKFIPFGVPGTVILLVNMPTIIAMPCGRILAAALMPAALYFGFKVARQSGNSKLVGAIVFAFIVNAAASCGPSPLGGIGTIGEGMTKLSIGSFGDAQQLGILFATTVCMVGMKFITPLTPPVLEEKLKKMGGDEEEEEDPIESKDSSDLSGKNPQGKEEEK